jgi:hypothetical protein
MSLRRMPLFDFHQLLAQRLTYLEVKPTRVTASSTKRTACKA